MYEYIKGVYNGMLKDYIIVENNGIGYKVYTSGSTLAKMPKIYDEVKLYLEQIVREDFIGLYGFLTKDELNLFNLVLTINGVGAKAALSLLSISSVNNLKYAILSGDEKTLTRAPGVGKKIAQRIILELKDKIKSDEIERDFNSEVNESAKLNIDEAACALISLGYTEKEALSTLKTVKCEENDSTEVIIKKCLKVLMK